jgi:hypothetical protein
MRRGYRLEANKINERRSQSLITETSGQLLYEWQHLKKKLRLRGTSASSELAKVKKPHPHPLFKIVAGQVRNWERQKAEPEGTPA